MGHIAVDRSDAKGVKKITYWYQRRISLARQLNLIFPEGTRVRPRVRPGVRPRGTPENARERRGTPKNSGAETNPHDQPYKSGIAFLYAKINCLFTIT